MDNSEKNIYRFEFLGSGKDIFLIYLKNAFFTFITLSLYFPWAKSRMRRYLASRTFFVDKPFRYVGTGRELIKSYVVLLMLLGVFFILNVLMGGFAWLLLIVLLALVGPFIGFRSYRYRLSRTSWQNIQFSLAPAELDFSLAVIGGNFFSLISLGLYAPIAHHNRVSIFFNALSIGNHKFSYKGTKKDLYALYAQGLFFSILTLGLYLPWAWMRVKRYTIENIWISNSHFKLNVSGLNFVGLCLLQLLVLPTFGFAIPWIQAFTISFIMDHLEINGILDLESITNVTNPISGSADMAAAFGGMSVDL